MYLASAGLVSIVFGLATSYGLCSYFGFVVSPLHNFIPFLLLGLGVDDMFVIVQALDMFDRNDSIEQSSPNKRVCYNIDRQNSNHEKYNNGNINKSTILENGPSFKLNHLSMCLNNTISKY